MAMNITTLSSEIVTLLSNNGVGEKTNKEDFYSSLANSISEAVINHIITNAEVDSNGNIT